MTQQTDDTTTWHEGESITLHAGMDAIELRVAALSCAAQSWVGAPDMSADAILTTAEKFLSWLTAPPPAARGLLDAPDDDPGNDPTVGEYWGQPDNVGLKLPEWTGEAHTEANHDDALAGFVVLKRKGTTGVGKWWALATVDDVLALMHGQRFGHRRDGE